MWRSIRGISCFLHHRKDNYAFYNYVAGHTFLIIDLWKSPTLRATRQHCVTSCAWAHILPVFLVCEVSKSK